MITRILIFLTLIMIGWTAFNWISQEREIRDCERQHLQVSGYINEGVSFYCRNKL